MKKALRLLLCALSLLCVCVHAATPNDKSLERLLIASGAEKLLESMQQQIGPLIKKQMNEALKKESVPPKAQLRAEKLQDKIIADFREELSWDKFKPIYMQVYRETFTQEEIDGLIAFYEGPAGQAFTKKMPLVMQKSIALTQQRMGPMMEKLQQSIKEAAEEVAADKD